MPVNSECIIYDEKRGWKNENPASVREGWRFEQCKVDPNEKCNTGDKAAHREPPPR